MIVENRDAPEQFRNHKPTPCQPAIKKKLRAKRPVYSLSHWPGPLLSVIPHFCIYRPVWGSGEQNNGTYDKACANGRKRQLGQSRRIIRQIVDLKVRAFSSIVAVIFPSTLGRKLLFSPKSEFGCGTVARPAPMRRQCFILWR